MTPAQSQALKWLQQYNGTGVFDKHGVLLAAGELAPIRRSTRNALVKAGMVTIERGTCGPARVTVRAAA